MSGGIGSREVLRAAFRQEPIAQRIKITEEVISTITPENLEIIFSGSKPHLARGLVWMEGLPFEFKAAYSTLASSHNDATERANIDFLHDTIVFDEHDNVTHPESWESNWHPYFPSGPYTDFSVSNSADDETVVAQKDGRKKSMLEHFGIQGTFMTYEQDALLGVAISLRISEYQQLFARFESEPRLFGIYSAAVRLACNAREDEMRNAISGSIAIR
ncbi:MAG: hypothetical protein RLZZ455_663 [Candidatus Parcubacteria bacterium]|jgi:hypothetical protein